MSSINSPSWPFRGAVGELFVQTLSASSAHVAEPRAFVTVKTVRRKRAKMLREQTPILIQQLKVQFWINMKDETLLLAHLKALKTCSPFLLVGRRGRCTCSPVRINTWIRMCWQVWGWLCSPSAAPSISKDVFFCRHWKFIHRRARMKMFLMSTIDVHVMSSQGSKLQLLKCHFSLLVYYMSAVLTQRRAHTFSSMFWN